MSEVKSLQQAVVDAKSGAGDQGQAISPKEWGQIVDAYGATDSAAAVDSVLTLLSDPDSKVYDPALASVLKQAGPGGEWADSLDASFQDYLGARAIHSAGSRGDKIGDVDGRVMDTRIDIGESSYHKTFGANQIGAAEAYAHELAAAATSDAVILRDSEGYFHVLEVEDLCERSGKSIAELRGNIVDLAPPKGMSVTAFVAGSEGQTEVVIPKLGDGVDRGLASFLEGFENLGINPEYFHGLQANGVTADDIDALINEVQNSKPQGFLRSASHPATKNATIRTLTQLKDQLEGDASFLGFVSKTDAYLNAWGSGPSANFV